MKRVGAVVVPDEAAWTMWGVDLARAGFEPTSPPERASALVVPDPLPAPLAAAVRDAWSRMDGRRTLVPLEAELLGTSPRTVVEAGAHDHAGHGGEAMERDMGTGQMDHGETDHGRMDHGDMDHGQMDQGEMDHGDMDHGQMDHGGMDHGGHDMMAIVGEPSADGLVMEDVALRLGPVSAVLPGGLVADLTLDGDVVARADLRATLHVPLDELSRGRPPDPLSPAAWNAAVAGASGRPWPGGVAAVERERLRSHCAWLRSLGRALGAAELTALATALLASGLTATDARALADRARRVLLGRWTRGRLRGRAVVEALDDLDGPNARAAGRAADARTEDPRYARLGFEPVLEHDGDALARCLVRVGEIAQSAELADRAGSDDETATTATVEGPRGSLRAVATGAGIAVAAPGAAAAIEAAGRAIAGLELAGAVAGLVSFDLSPWRLEA